ncbi:hypothetical protein GJ744_004449 [Endocarpon pusillum]|uniref:Uncharacterized protein n=1 Tax=Endocarpon pusillum TaxID=364733 RepID=A0A8H7ATL4_9EURO|nr:hypothetical protein GJ744_004449 [Endocarpon pusillum]
MLGEDKRQPEANLQHSRKVDSERNQVVDDEDRRRINVQYGRVEGVRQVHVCLE